MRPIDVRLGKGGDVDDAAYRERATPPLQSRGRYCV
jgi:hypothetical protein